jgi:hypothetical protein
MTSNRQDLKARSGNGSKDREAPPIRSLGVLPRQEKQDLEFRLTPISSWNRFAQSLLKTDFVRYRYKHLDKCRS